MRTALLRLLVLALLALSAAAVGPLPSSGSTVPSSMVLVFVDASSGLRLTIEADPASRDAGMFAFSVATRGTYLSVTPATLAVSSPQSTNVTFSGIVDLVSDGSSRMRLSARLQAHLDPVHHIAEATLTTDQDRYHLVAKAVTHQGLEGVLKTFESAVTGGDWATIYEISSSEYTRSLARDLFIASARSQASTAGKIAKLQRLKIGEVQTNRLGISFVVVPYEVTRSVDGTMRIAREDMYFLYEDDAWRVWFGVAR